MHQEDVTLFAFRDEPIPSLGLLGRFSAEKRASALSAAARSVLARAGAVADLSEGVAFSALCEEYRVSDAAATTLARQILDDSAAVALSDGRLTDDERAELEGLASWMGLSPDASERAIENEAARRYEEAVALALRDGRLSDEEATVLRDVAEQVGLHPERARPIYTRAAHQVLRDLMAEQMADGEVSSEEAAALSERVAQFDVELPEIDRAFSWAIAAHRVRTGGDLPIIDPGGRLALQRGEQLHLYMTCGLTEQKHVTRRVNYGGARARVKVMKGVYLHGGTIASQPVRTLEMVPVDRGLVFVTTKRVLLDGVTRNHTITFRSVLDFEVFADGFRLGKTNGGNLYYSRDGSDQGFQPQLFHAVLSRLTSG